MSDHMKYATCPNKLGHMLYTSTGHIAHTCFGGSTADCPTVDLDIVYRGLIIGSGGAYFDTSGDIDHRILVVYYNATHDGEKYTFDPSTRDVLNTPLTPPISGGSTSQPYYWDQCEQYFGGESETTYFWEPYTLTPTTYKYPHNVYTIYDALAASLGSDMPGVGVPHTVLFALKIYDSYTVPGVINEAQKWITSFAAIYNP